MNALVDRGKDLQTLLDHGQRRGGRGIRVLVLAGQHVLDRRHFPAGLNQKPQQRKQHG